MHIRIDHLTQYKYSEPARSLIQLLRLTPRSNAHQTVMDWRIDVDCDARLTPFVDAHGNFCHMMAIDHMIDSLSIETCGQVHTSPSTGIVDATQEQIGRASCRERVVQYV